MLIVSSAISVSAQKDYRDNGCNDRYHYKYDGDRKKDVYKRHDRHFRNRQEFRRQVAQINYDFDRRVRSIERNPFMSRGQKARKIHELEMHRRIALRECHDRFSGNRGRDYARDRRR